jgi:hypothetical protein
MDISFFDVTQAAPSRVAAGAVPETLALRKAFRTALDVQD